MEYLEFTWTGIFFKEVVEQSLMNWMLWKNVKLCFRSINVWLYAFTEFM